VARGRLRPALVLLVALATTLAGTQALAQYPTRIVRLVVGFPPGGGPDMVARILAAKLADVFGEPVVVETRPGGNGAIAGDAVAKSAPDGYTLLVGNDSLFVISPHMYKSMPLDPLKDLTPVASLVSNGFFLAVNPSVPARSFTEFIEYARRANPPLQYGSGGSGSQHHITMERLKARAGIELIHVPYKGGAPATTATVAGEVAAMMSGTSTAAQIRSGRLRALAYTGPKRSSVLPDVPAIAEFYPDFVMVQWYGLFAPAATPQAIVARLRAEVNKLLALPDVKDKLLNAGGVEPWITTSEEFSAEIRDEHAKYGKLVKDIGAKVE